ncbi:hypothetical protein ABLE93_00435 [Xanthobacter sp. KR7-65]|uniref:hypothetical protein n=1 Tax=Xanthobacter sp. KR7-65 TaxID=3156612 RepID=UPI0032B3DD97
MLAVALVAGAAPAAAQAPAAGKADTTCAAYGADFKRVPGSDSCVRTGAAVRTDVYGGQALSSAPNQFSATPTAPPASPPQPSLAVPADPWKSAR